MHIDDYTLITACQSGDITAFETLVRKYQDRIVRVLYLLLGNADDAQDVAQEAFVRAYQYIGAFRGRSSFPTWLHRIAINAAHNWIRDNRRRTELPTDPHDLRSSDAATPEGAMLAHERTMDIQSALAELPQHYREAVVLRYFDELSYEEIADVQQIPVGTVRSRLAKGREILANALRTGPIDENYDGRTESDELQTRNSTNPG